MPVSGVRMTVLFLCTGNAARSIMAEALLRHYGGDRFQALSAGSDPTGRVHPLSLETLADHGIAATGVASKTIEQAVTGKAVDIVITVCDSAAENCPVLPAAPVQVHWGLPDPAAATGDRGGQRAAFAAVFGTLRGRIEQLTALPLTGMTREDVKRSLLELARDEQ